MNVRFLISLFSLLVSSTILLAQNSELTPLPMDPNLRYGVLPNGLTYYIRHNALPKDRADFYIAQKVGSILEEDSQRGLAHFLEHMAFNGTKNYPGKSLLNYLESIGVKFGANLNAYTSIDETVYNITGVPAREGAIDSCLLILHDWGSAISLEDKEIDSERGVISEEWRTRRGAGMRMMETITPEIYAGSQYADRFPIGKLEIIQNFPYQAIRDYYKKWYRPDQQAIIVVGDINVDQVEEKIKSIFGPVSMPVNAAERVYYPVPDNHHEPIIVTATDKEATNTQIMLFFKHDPLSPQVKASAQGFTRDYISTLASWMINNRFSEIIKKPNTPFLSAGVGDGSFFLSKTKDAFSGSIVCKEGEVSKALTAFLDELYRVDQYGFTESEFQRTVADYQSAILTAYNERNKQQTGTYTQTYINHFTEGGSVSGIESEYQMLQQLGKSVTLQQVNAFIKQLIKNDNIVLAVMGPEKEGVFYPDKAELLTILTEASKKQLTPYEDKVSNEPLLAQPPVAGKVMKESLDKKLDATVWKLSNGATVIVKSTDYKDDEIQLTASSPGGTSQFTNPKDIINNKLINIVPIGGYGNFDAIALDKVLAGKQVSASASVSAAQENLSGNSNKRDLETMMQLLYLKATSPRKDIDAFNAWMERNREGMKNRALNPSAAFNDTVMAVCYLNDPRAQALKLEDLDQVDYDRIIKMYKDRFADFSDFTFTLVGNVNTDSLKPLVEKYIASLPSIKRKEVGQDLTVVPGIRKNHFDRPMETPKSSVYVTYSGKEKYSYEKAVQMQMLASILRIVYVKTIREEQGGTYGVSVSENFSKRENQYILRFSFDTNADKEATLTELAKNQITKLATDGPSLEDLNKVKENMLKVFDEYKKLNGWWLSRISALYTQDIDWSNHIEIVEKQTPETIRKFAASLLKHKNEVEVVMTGTQKEK